VSCVSITDEILLRGIQRGVGPGGLRELTRAVAEIPSPALESRQRRQASLEADDFGLRGDERRSFIEERVARLRANPFSTLLPTTTVAASRTATPSRIMLDRLRRPHVEVTLSSGARHGLEQEIQAWAPERVETGGFLFSHYGTEGGQVHVCHVSGPAPDSLHRRCSVTIGRVADVRATFPDFLARQDLIHVGSFHTHPDGDGEPSQADRRAWARMLTPHFPSYVAVIATPGPPGLGWGAPRFHGWHTFNDGGRVIVEPATIID